ncbi:3-hydroxyacyl-CoA dehydrogenase [Aestuariivirga sp.]|uniref:3-hydroxyacyl-CoA dehydrogenase n=1 Tax=Aestuariivirga sp. TaxID=2650926 RepID=UPI0039E4C670
MSRTAIIGSGFIGRAWAISFARAGHEVALWDADAAQAEKARGFIEGVLDDLNANDLLNGQTPRQVLARIRPEARLEAALDGVAYVQENTPEKIPVKIEVFGKLDALAPADAVLASSTSAILPSQFTEGLKGRHRCIVVHPINPPYLIPAAEVVPAPWTSLDIVARTRAFLVAAGHAPLVMKKEIDGFIMNRMQAALVDEAFRLVEGGYASAEDVDIGIRDGLALRWSFMGPFETMDLNAPGGVRDYGQRYEHIFITLAKQMQKRANWQGPVMDEVERDRRARVPKDKLAERQVWRDRRLMALVAHKRKAARDIGE